MTRRAPGLHPDIEVSPWRGAMRPYDLVKEVTICFVVVVALTVGLAVVFSSPDERAITMAQWSNAQPVDFAQTAISELDGTSTSANYGPPYNHGPNSQQLFGVSPERLIGVHLPLNTAQDFVLGPLSTQRDLPGLAAALEAFAAASPAERASWEQNYEGAITASAAGFTAGHLVVARGDYGPVGTMIDALTTMARSGALDTSMLTEEGFYSTNFTKPLLLLADSPSYLSSIAQAQHLAGGQWGMMNETGKYPGQAWLWLYTLWYQVPPMKTSSNADLEVWAIMMLLTAGLLLVPYIPGLRSIPRWSRIYRLIWRQHYRSMAVAQPKVNE